MSSLTSYRTAVLALLDDPSKTRYSDPQLDQALRMALSDYTRARPLINTCLLTTDGNQRLALPADLAALCLLKVEVWNDDPDLVIEIPFTADKVDEQWTLETVGQTILSGGMLIITFATSHTIDALDGAAGTSLPGCDEAILQAGAAGYAALARSSSRAETINMQPQVSAQVARVAEVFLARFREGIQPGGGAVFAGPPTMSVVVENGLLTRAGEERGEP